MSLIGAWRLRRERDLYSMYIAYRLYSLDPAPTIKKSGAQRDDMDNSYADYIELALQLQFNERSRE